MDDLRNAFVDYYSNHPSAVDSLRKENEKIKNLENIRTYLAKPLLRIENIPLKLRDLEK